MPPSPEGVGHQLHPERSIKSGARSPGSRNAHGAVNDVAAFLDALLSDEVVVLVDIHLDTGLATVEV